MPVTENPPPETVDLACPGAHIEEQLHSKDVGKRESPWRRYKGLLKWAISKCNWGGALAATGALTVGVWARWGWYLAPWRLMALNRCLC